jgi:hypothetical protein
MNKNPTCSTIFSKCARQAAYLCVYDMPVAAMLTYNAFQSSFGKLPTCALTIALVVLVLRCSLTMVSKFVGLTAYVCAQDGIGRVCGYDIYLCHACF